jgi:heme A synthase
MEERASLSRFTKFAWFVLAYNIVVILWGVFLRASKSGDGCGQHWLTCHGEVIPSAPELKTIIEFSHRLTTGPAFLFVLILLIWALMKFGKGHAASKMALLAFVFIITEVLVGAVLVLTGNTADAVTAARPFWAVGHLLNTFALLAFLTLTAWYSTGDKKIDRQQLSSGSMILIGLATLGIVLVSISGSLAALGNMLFPSETLVEGISKDFSEASNILLRLRLSHPILAILTGVFLIFLSGWMKKSSGDDPDVARWSGVLSIVVLVQIAFGAATLLTLGPIVMQVGHLFLADLLWISFVLLSANYLLVASPVAEPDPIALPQATNPSSDR